jgi:hypothetical protein
MKFDDKFQNARVGLIREISALINISNGLNSAKKIPKLVGTQVFLKRYERLPQQKKIELVGEYKRRLIRFQDCLRWQQNSIAGPIENYMVSAFIECRINPQLRIMFRKLSEVDGSRNVPLTPNMSTLKRG